jgi:hypothetical protein
MFTCGELGCDCGGGCVRRHAHSRSRHLTFSRCTTTSQILLDPAEDSYVNLIIYDCFRINIKFFQRIHNFSFLDKL